MGYKLGTTIFGLCALLGSASAAIAEDIDSNQIGRGLDAKSVLTSLANNFISRGYGTTATGSSQIVSLNLTNLLVLVLLKALIFAAGSLGAGHWKGGYARSLDGEEKLVSDEEILMFLSFLSGSPGCLQNIACQQPAQAKKYVAVGDMLLKFSKLFSINSDINYDYVLQEMEQAANAGLAGNTCSNFECGNT